MLLCVDLLSRSANLGLLPESALAGALVLALWVAFTDLLPLVGAFLLLFVGKDQDDTIRWIANGVSLIGFLLSAPLWFWYDPKNPAFQFVERAPWIPSIGAESPR